MELMAFFAFLIFAIVFYSNNPTWFGTYFAFLASFVFLIVFIVKMIIAKRDKPYRLAIDNRGLLNKGMTKQEVIQCLGCRPTNDRDKSWVYKGKSFGFASTTTERLIIYFDYNNTLVDYSYSMNIITFKSR